MDRNDHPTSVAAPLTPRASAGNEGHFAPEDSDTGQKATIVTYEWAEGVQEAIVGTIEAAGITPDKTDYTLFLQALRTLKAKARATNTVGSGVLQSPSRNNAWATNSVIDRPGTDRLIVTTNGYFKADRDAMIIRAKCLLPFVPTVGAMTTGDFAELMLYKSTDDGSTWTKVQSVDLWKAETAAPAGHNVTLQGDCLVELDTDDRIRFEYAFQSSALAAVGLATWGFMEFEEL